MSFVKLVVFNLIKSANIVFTDTIYILIIMRIMSLPKPRAIKIERYVGGLSKLKKVSNPFKLSANESALGPSPKVIRVLEKEKKKIFKYPDSDCYELRKILSKNFKINPDKIICGSGSDQIFDLTCQLFLRPGDEVITTEYGFIMHRIYASLYGAKVLFAKEKNFKASIKEIIKKVSNKTKIVFIANPNNPTGTFLTKNEMLQLRKKLRQDILLVVDDAYFEFLYQHKHFISGLELFKNSQNVLVTRTFSKVYGLAGLRLGWGYSSKKIIKLMNKIKPPFNVNKLALSAGTEAIKDKAWINKAIKYNSKWSKKIFSVLQSHKIRCNMPSANFFLINFDNVKLNSDEVFRKLSSKRIILRKMTQYKIQNSLRLTVGNKKANEHLIRSIGEIFK